MSKPINRRSFLRIGAATGIASGLSWKSSALAEGKKAASEGVKKYSTLGKTGLEISDISFGASRLRTGQEDLVSHALDLGVNYIDTAESYTKSVSESVIGNAIKGKRDKLFLATKTHAGANTSADQIMQSLEASLARLQTDYVDIFFNHAVNDIERLQNPEWFKFVDRARQQGKIRFTGLSGHAGRLVDVVNHAVDNELVDVLLLAQNFGQDPAFYERFTQSFDFVANQPELPKAMARAKQKNIGVIAMKVLRGAKLNDMRPFEKQGHTYAQAAFKWALRNPDVDAAIISMTSHDNIEEYLGASGDTEITDYDFELLQQYARLTDMTYCRHACNDCEGACPYNVEISDVLRTRMYATDYGDIPFARSEYAGIGTNASACLSCDGAPCRDACSHGLNIAKLCGPTHQMLS